MCAFLLICLNKADWSRSTVRRRTLPQHLLDLRLNRLPTYPPTHLRRLQTAFHSCPHKAGFRALAKHRDLAGSRRTRPLHPNCRPQLRYQEPRHRGNLPRRFTHRSLPPRRRQRYREMAQYMRREITAASYAERRRRRRAPSGSASTTESPDGNGIREAWSTK